MSILRWLTARTWISLLKYKKKKMFERDNYLVSYFKSIELSCLSFSALYNKNLVFVKTAYCFFHPFFLTFSFGIFTGPSKWLLKQKKRFS
jgi:hypothetical protein